MSHHYYRRARTRVFDVTARARDNFGAFYRKGFTRTIGKIKSIVTGRKFYQNVFSVEHGNTLKYRVVFIHLFPLNNSIDALRNVLQYTGVRTVENDLRSISSVRKTYRPVGGRRNNICFVCFLRRNVNMPTGYSYRALK